MTSNYRAVDPDVDIIATQSVVYCAQNDVENPIEILRHFQKEMCKGRALEVECLENCEDGSTNFILVDRHNLLETALDEIKQMADYRLTLQVQFYGEVSIQGVSKKSALVKNHLQTFTLLTFINVFNMYLWFRNDCFK